MAVRQEGSGWRVDVCVVAPDGRTMRKKKRCRTRREAERYEHELRHALLAGNYERREEAPTLSNWSKQYLEVYAEVTLKPSTVDSIKDMLRLHLLPVFGPSRIDKIGRLEAAELVARLKRKGLKPKTINNTLACLHGILAKAADYRLIPSPERFDWLDAPKPSWRFLESEEAEAIIEHAGRWRSMILVALRTGLRAGELRGLQWHDVDLGRRRLQVRRAVVDGLVVTPKTGRPRVVALTADAVETLREERHLRGPWVWCSPSGGPVAESVQRRGLLEACHNAGIEPCGWHVLRHTFASHLMMRGAPMRVVQELLGHTAITMTERYAHVAPDALTEAVDKLTAQQRPT